VALMDKNAIIKSMTLEEKASLCSGLGSWWTKPIERLNIPSIMMTDGPHGLRKQKTKTEQVGIHESYPATCFPPAVNLASSFNLDLVKQVGKHIAIEAKAEGISIVLGPGVNIKRHPFGGRNFEYFSEDPFLSGRMASAYIEGVQNEGIGTSLKHYVANNQETNRMSIDTIIDERTLHELYLASFKHAIIEAKPWTIMASYNLINGKYACENEILLNNVLRKIYHYQGVAISDWGAINDRVEGLKATLDLEMPSSKGMNDQLIVEAVRQGKLDESVLDESVKRMLNLIELGLRNRDEKATYDQEVHHQFARKVASETMVLLKNESSILPLDLKKKLVVIGEFAQKPRYQGAGSSQIVPTRLDTFTDILDKEYPSVKYQYSSGHNLDEASLYAKKGDVVLLFVGLPNIDEAEGYDRKKLGLNAHYLSLIDEVSKVNSNVVVILSNGSPIEMPWLERVPALLETYLGGQAKNGAIADLLFGKVNPSARLAETFPNDVSEFPANYNFPGQAKQVLYKEGLYVGYRYYVSASISPRFCFGYGLSYTTFEYKNLKLTNHENHIHASFTVSNIGNMDGYEVCQLYVSLENSKIYRPKIELKGFKKVWIAKNEAIDVEIVICKDDLRYYDTHLKSFELETGDYTFYIGQSSCELKLNDTIFIQGISPQMKMQDAYYHIGPNFNPSDQDFETLLEKPIPLSIKKRPFTRRSTLNDIKSTLIGRIIYRKILNKAKKSKSKSMSTVEEKMLIETMSALPLKTLVSFGGIQNHYVEAIICLLNHRYIKAIHLILKNKKTA
jgi:beta-glucosidase